MKKLLLIAAASAVLAACGGSSGGGSSSGFGISSISPANNTQIPVTQAFVANFTNQLNPNTIGNVTMTTESGTSVLITCGINGATAIQCTPTSALSYGTGYRLTFGGGIQNAAGNSLTPVTYSYTTFQNQGIASVVPASGSINPNNTTWSFTFGESMQLATLNTSQTPGNVTFAMVSPATTSKRLQNASIPITCTSTNAINMSCSLSESQLALGESYQLTLTNKIISATNVPLTPQTLNYAATNYVTPTVIVNPQAGAVGLNQLSYGLTFNTTMQAATFANNVIMTDTTNSTNYNMNCSTQNNIAFTCTIQGLQQLIYNHNYTLSLGSGIQSSQNIPLAATSLKYSASNATVPAVNFISPSGGAVSPTQLTYIVQFTESMATSSFAGNVSFTDTTINNPSITINCTSSDNINYVCTVGGISQLTYTDNYRLTLSNGITSRTGVPLNTVSYTYVASNAVIPQVSSINPSNGSAIGVSGVNFIATFTTPMNTGTFTNANIGLYDVTASLGIAMNCSATSSTVATCTPTANLIPYHNYSLTYTNAITSALGVPMNQVGYSYTAVPSGYTWSQLSSIPALGNYSYMLFQYSNMIYVMPGSMPATTNVYGINVNGNVAQQTSTSTQNMGSFAVNGNGIYATQSASMQTIADQIYFSSQGAWQNITSQIPTQTYHTSLSTLGNGSVLLNSWGQNSSAIALLSAGVWQNITGNINSLGYNVNGAIKIATANADIYAIAYTTYPTALISKYNYSTGNWDNYSTITTTNGFISDVSVINGDLYIAVVSNDPINNPTAETLLTNKTGSWTDLENTGSGFVKSGGSNDVISSDQFGNIYLGNSHIWQYKSNSNTWTNVSNNTGWIGTITNIAALQVLNGNIYASVDGGIVIEGSAY